MKALLHSIAGCRLLFSVLAIFATIAPVRSEDAAPPPPPPEAKWTVIAECQMVMLPQKLALSLIPDLSDDDKIEAAWARVKQMIERGEATLIANLNVRGDAGARMVAESVEEVRYAVEFTPPQLPGEVGAGKSADGLKNWPIVGITPTAFETRNVGEMLELEPQVSDDGQWISMGVSPSHVRFLRFVKTDAGILASGAHLSIEQPYFSTLKNTMSMHVKAGQRVLVGVHKVPTDEANMELFVLRIRTQKVGSTK